MVDCIGPPWTYVSVLDMVGVASSNLVAPTKFGRKIKHLAETLSAFFSSVGRSFLRPWVSGGLKARLCLRPTMTAVEPA